MHISSATDPTPHLSLETVKYCGATTRVSGDSTLEQSDFSGDRLPNAGLPLGSMIIVVPVGRLSAVDAVIRAGPRETSQLPLILDLNSTHEHHLTGALVVIVAHQGGGIMVARVVAGNISGVAGIASS
jgi:hypothetical protein